MKKFYLTFRALRHRNYLLFFIGQCLSLIGTWIQQIAISWLVYRLTNSALMMGIITFTGSIPMLILSPFAGVLTDRLDKHKALIFTQLLFMTEALVLAILTLSNSIQIWEILLLTAFIGITNTIDMPLRQAFVVRLVDGSDDLGNAISLNSSMFNLARMVGPAIAGVLIAAVGEGSCFLINSLSYIAVIAALLAMNIKSKPIAKHKEANILKELKEGFHYAYKEKIIKNTLLFLAISSFIGMSFQVLMPIFAKEVLHGNAQTLGILMSASGIGALSGALKLASRVTSEGLEKEMSITAFIFAFGILCLAFTHNFWVAVALLMLTGFGMVTIMASCNTIIQKNVAEDKRGRVMSLYSMAFIGTAPLGSLFEGFVAEHIGVSSTFLLNGIIMAIFVSVFHLKYRKPAEVSSEA